MLVHGSGKTAVSICSLLLFISFYSPALLQAAEGDLLWTYTTGDDISSSPAIGSDGTIYVGSDDNNLYAINPDGTQKWAFTAGTIIRSSPAIGSDGTVYAGSYDKKLYAINPDGTQKWAFTTGNFVHSSPAIGSDGTVYVGSNDDKLYAINPDDGSQKWAFTTGSYIGSSPAIGSDGTVYVGSTDCILYAINPADGSQKWTFTTGNFILSSPAISSDGTVYVGSYDKKLYAINPDGTQKWAFTTGNIIESSPAIGSDGTVYVGSDDSKLYAINPADGSQKWVFTAGNFIVSSPAIGSDGTVYVGSNDDKLYAINPAGGSQKWAFTTGGDISSSPAIGSDGTIYIGSCDWRLYAIDTGTGAGLADTPWPKFRHNLRNTGLDAPEITITGAPVAIGNITAGTSGSGTFTINNDGYENLIVSNITIDNDRFRLSPSSATIAPGTGQAVTVTFHAFSVAPRSATITVASNDSDESELTVSVSATVQPAPEIKVGTYCKTFGTDNTVGSSSSLELTLKNSGTAELVISNITSSSPAFAVSPVSATLAAGASRAFTVTFTPTAAGEHSAKVTVNSNAWNSAVLDFTGGAVSGPQIALTAPSPFYLGQVALGLSLSRSFTISNPGSETLVVSSIACEQQGPFSVSPGSVEIAAGGSREVAVTFTPTFASSSIQHGYITITSNDSDEGSLRLHVAGAAREAPIMVLSTSLLDFGGVPAGDSEEKVLRVYNTGTLELVLSGISVSEGAVFSVSPDAAVVAAGESVQLTVTFSPPAVGSYQGELVITEEETEARVSLTGEGTSPPLFSGATGNETFKNTTGSYNLWVELGDQLADPEVRIIISQDAGETFPDTMDCTCEQEGQFTVPLPARELGSCLYYFFEVSEPSGAVYRFPEAAPQECFILDVSLTKKGDANGDWTTNVLDLLQLLRIFQGLEPSSPLADLNGDGKVNVFDLIALLRML